jgi:hypothetical protein
MSRLLATATWKSLKTSLAAALGTSHPSRRERHLTQAGPAIAAVLHATAVNADTDQRDQVVAFLVQDNEDLTTAVLSTLRAGAHHPADVRRDGGLDALAAHGAARLSTRLARPQRADDDWSIELPAGCTCPLCAELSAFLADPGRRSYEWPLAERKRQHVHIRIDASELPVRHETRRKGSPYTLVLTKTIALFERENDQRRRDTADLAWIQRTFPTTRPSQRPAGRPRRTTTTVERQS